MNPPFKGAVDKGGVHPTLPGDTTKSELLFLHLILRALDMGGRCAVIVPDGVLFGSSRAHVEIRKKIKVHYIYATKLVNGLEEAGLVEGRREGRKHLVWLNESSPIVKSIRGSGARRKGGRSRRR